jgi:hypothetical protein
MHIAKTEHDRVKLYDARTGNVTLNLPVGEPIVGPALVQGNDLIVQVRNGAGLRTKVYDTRTGNLKANLP